MAGDFKFFRDIIEGRANRERGREREKVKMLIHHIITICLAGTCVLYSDTHVTILPED